MIRALIADDEPLARRGLRSRLGEYADIDIVAETGDGETTAEAIRRHQPDVVFLDVEMPSRPGTRVARELRGAGAPQIIFVSAYPQYAVDAFEIAALDYLLKPVPAKRLSSAIDRLRKRLGSGVVDTAGGLTIQVRDAGKTRLLGIEDVDYIRAAGDYMVIHAGNERLVHRTTLGRLAGELAPAGVLRIHRSTLLAPSRVKRLHAGANGDGQVELYDGTRLRFSRTYRAALHNALGLTDRPTEG